MGRATTFESDQLRFKRLGDIAGEQPVVESYPDCIEAFLAMHDEVAPETKVRVGGESQRPETSVGCSNSEVDATGAASASVAADDPESVLRESARTSSRRNRSDSDDANGHVKVRAGKFSVEP